MYHSLNKATKRILPLSSFQMDLRVKFINNSDWGRLQLSSSDGIMNALMKDSFLGLFISKDFFILIYCNMQVEYTLLFEIQSL